MASEHWKRRVDDIAVERNSPPLHAAWIAAAALSFWAAGTASARSQEASLAEIVAAWQERQAKIEPLVLEWDEIAMEKKGSHFTSENAALLGIPAPMAQGAYPPEDWEWRERPKLMLMGRMMRYEVTQRQYDSTTGRFHQVPLVSSHDGSHHRSLQRREGHYSGQEEDEDALAGLDAWRMPALLAVRPYSRSNFERCAFDVRDLSIESRHALVRDIPCIAVREKLRGPGNYFIHYVDPTRGYGIVKSTSVQLAGPRFQLEISYQAKNGLWLPTGWEMGVFVHGTENVGRTRTATVTRCDINTPLSADTFHLEFPPGTRVSRDPMLGPDYIVPPKYRSWWLYWVVAVGGLVALLLAWLRGRRGRLRGS